MDYLPPGTQKLNTNTKKMMHIAIAVVVIFFGGFLLWAALAPLSSGIVVPGTVATSARLNIIQSPQTAKIKSILVKEGEVVKKNQPLIILDDSEAKATYAKAKSEYLYLLSMESRLQAQLQNSPDITFPKELLENAQDPYVSNLIQTQRQLFFSTMQNFQSQKNAILQNTAGLQSELYGLKLNADSFKSQVSILAQQISSLKPLAKEGYYPKNQFLDKERQYEELKGNLDNLLGQIGRIQTQIAENNAKLQNLQSQFLADTQGKLAEVDSQLSSAKYQYLYYKKIYESMTIKSPINGTVLYLTVHTIGAVAAQGQELLEILPIDSKFIIEAQVEPQDIDKVHLNQDADLNFIAFNVHTTPIVHGKVIYVSADTITTQNAKMPFYIVRIELTKDAIKKLAHKKIVAGMPVQVTIKTGKQSMLEYLLKPLTENFSKAFKE
ncbi:MAG: hypothetical protein C0173_02755 [Desulfurella sp.]|uniref:HlyD family type I secretion periplasmic adaptor subunit n=1 Tax=Desulfurella sp. TaxID=1962857 RepID=UPI000CB95BA7|nr:HlyD family type I secretion periplasmic adaptor subunit [Desulfurella sp.]PMP91992.1 MAG: hypothetical protein C0173_02755 [Desulfurella sp.]